MSRISTFIFISLLFILSSFTNAFAQCGPAGLDPCSIPKIIRPVIKTVVNKSKSVKKVVVPDANKTTQSKNKTTKTTKKTKADPKDTSIYDSLILTTAPKNAAVENDFFPLNGVVIGKTTEAQIQILNGQRNVYTDPKTKEQKIYYTLGKQDFWLNDGIADLVPVFKFDLMPTKWTLLGFNFNLSYNKSISLLKSLGYKVETFVDLPKLEEIGTGKNTTARIKATKNSEIPLVVGMNFIFDSGKNFDSPDSLFYMVVGVKH